MGVNTKKHRPATAPKTALTDNSIRRQTLQAKIRSMKVVVVIVVIIVVVMPLTDYDNDNDCDNDNRSVACHRQQIILAVQLFIDKSVWYDQEKANYSTVPNHPGEMRRRYNNADPQTNWHQLL